MNSTNNDDTPLKVGDTKAETGCDHHHKPYDIEIDKYYNNITKQYRISIADGRELLHYLKLITQKHGVMLYTVSVLYELLSGRKESKLDYTSSQQYRTKNFSNGTPNISLDVRDWLFEKGEIYYPENPLLIDLKSVKLWVTELTLPFYKTEDRKVESIRSINRGVYSFTYVSNVLEAVYFYTKGHHPFDNNRIKIPKVFLDRGYTSIYEINKLSISEQIKLINLITRKGKTYSKPISLITYEDLEKLHPNRVKSEIVICFDKGLLVITHCRLEGLNLKSRSITSRNIYPICDSIYVCWDTEWSWTDEKDHQLVEYPDLLTYSIIDWGVLNLGERDHAKNVRVLTGKNCILKFLEILIGLANTNKGRRIYGISHNAAKVEHTFVLNAITKWFENTENYQIEFNHVDGPHVFSFRWKTIEFRDSILFIPLSLQKACEGFKLKNKKIEIDKEEFLKIDWTNPTDRDLEYARMDAIALGELVYTYTRHVSMAIGLQYVINVFDFRSGASIMKWWLIDPNSNLGWDSIDIAKLRDSVFFGGRCECFYLGTDKTFVRDQIFSNSTAHAFKIDVTSSYPFSMTNERLPGKIIAVHKPADKDELYNLIDDKSRYFVIGKPKFKSKVPYPLLGFRQDNKLIFPNLISGETMVCFWDFEYLAIYDNIESMSDVEVIEFEVHVGIQDKIRYLFEARKLAKAENNESLAYALKILMNSGYGSLALNPVREHSALVKGTFLERKQKYEVEHSLWDGPNGFKWFIYNKRSQVNSIIFLASFITAHSRFILWSKLKELADMGTYPIYCDTDSVITIDRKDREEYYKSSYPGTNLGSWKYEGSTNSWEIRGLKVYRFGEDVFYKGISGKDLLDEQGLIKKTINMKVWSCGREGVITFKELKKTMSFEYTKGFTMPDGTITPPTI